MLLALPQPGFRSLLRSVICFQRPMAPAQISGGSLKESRMTAEDVPSAETEIFGPQSPAETLSTPRQNLETLRRRDR